MGLKFKVENLDNVAEELKKLYTERDGAFYLDVEGMPSGKTDEDVKKLQNALEKERKDHKEAKEKIRAFVDEFGDSESIRERFEELENIKSTAGSRTKSCWTTKSGSVRLRKSATATRRSLKRVRNALTNWKQSTKERRFTAS